MALSIEEQRILDGMERKLADDDPRLASRLSAFGQPRLPAALGTGKVRVAVIVMALALAAVVTLMIYSMRPAPVGSGRQAHPAQQARMTTSPAGQSSGSPELSRPSAPSTS